MKIIKTNNLTKIFITKEIETTAVNKISIEITQGEFVAIMGPSGCGKTTLLNMLGLLDNLSAGEYTFLDNDVSKYKESQRAKLRKSNIGFIFQNFNLIQELNVFDNVEMPLVYLKLSKKERKQRVETVLEKLDIAHRAKHFPSQLSGGQQQRVAVARAVASNPKLILADEPTGNLDSKNGNDVMELLTTLNKEGTTIIMVTHSKHDANYANRIIQLFDGKIVIDKSST